MKSDGAPETEVPPVEDESNSAGQTADMMQDSPQPKGAGGAKAKRKWTKVNTADYYNPTPYAAAKGRGMGKGSGKGGGKDGEGGGHKGKGKGAAYQADHHAGNKNQDDDNQVSNVDGTSVSAGDGDPLQSKGGGGKRKQGGKGREGKGKGGKSSGQRKGKSRGGPMPSEVPEIAPETEGPRPPGPQRPAAPAKGTGAQGMGGMSVAVAPYSYGVPYSYGGAVPYAYGAAVPAMFAVPYHMVPAPGPMNTGSAQYMSGTGPPPPASNTTDRPQLKQNVQAQIEYYFGQENLIKDLYLRSRLMDEEGWVPIALVAGFRRIQSMTNDLSIIQEAVAASQKLELNAPATHVRLKDNWGEWILPPKRTEPNPAVQTS